MKHTHSDTESVTWQYNKIVLETHLETHLDTQIICCMLQLKQLALLIELKHTPIL